MEIGADTSRRVGVKLRPGPKRRKDGELTPAAALTKRRIADVAWRLALAGTWPSPEAIGDADEGLTRNNVAHHRDALEAARMKWVELYGPHSHWKAPNPVAGTGSFSAAVGDGEGSVGLGEAAGAHDAATVDPGSGNETAATEVASATASGATTRDPARILALDTRIEALEGRIAALEADLDKEQRRVARLEHDVEDRDTRIDTLNETLDNLRDLNGRLMLNLRKDLPVYDNGGGPPPV